MPGPVGPWSGGSAGTSGYSGLSGYSGYSGVGTSGYSGYSGLGTSGYSGYSGNAASINATDGVMPYKLDAGALADSPLVRVDANTIAQRNGATPQVLILSNGYTDDSNYGRARHFWNSNNYTIATEAVGTGNAQDITISSRGATGIIFQTSGSQSRWFIDASGYLKTWDDNSYDVGASASARPRVVYVGTRVVAPTLKTVPVAFASLPASPEEGMMAWVNDSNTSTWGATAAGGGSDKVMVVYNGTNWTVAGK